MPGPISSNRSTTTTTRTTSTGGARTNSTTRTTTPGPAIAGGWTPNARSFSAADHKAFAQSNFSQADAKAAMKAFNLATLKEAQGFIGNALRNGKVEVLRKKGITAEEFDNHECLQAFNRSQYTDADVKAAKKNLPFLNSASTQAVKEYIGLKIVNGSESILEEAGITPTKFDSHDLLAAFNKAGYTSAQVKAAKKQFDFLKNLPDNEVKEYIGLKVVNGYESMLQEKGIKPPALSLFGVGNTKKAFERSTYTEADAKQALKKLPFLGSLAEAKEYIGLKVLQGTEDILADVGITPAPYDEHECLAAFEKAGYSDADAKAAKKAFDFLKTSSMTEVKAYMGLKVINDYQQMLSEVGIVPAK